MQLTFRIDAREGVTADKVREFFDKYSDIFEKYLIYEEVADVTGKVHWQGIIYTESTIGSIREKVRRFFPGMSTGDYSLAKVKTENYEIYITKDKKRLVSKGYTDDEINTLEEKSFKKKNLCINKKGEQKKLSPMEIYREWVYNRIAEKGIDIKPNRDGLFKVYELTLEYYGKIVNKGFAIKRIKESSDYIFYNMFDYEEVKFTETNLVTYYTDWKERLINKIHDA